MMLAALLLAAAEPETAIDAERAFAKDAQELGQWTAFAKWADDEAVLVGKSVIPAKEFAQSQENPQTALEWWPVESIVSCDQTLAVNLGGWRDPSTGASGQFHTVWKKTPNGWRYLVDLGSEGADALPSTGAVKVTSAACDSKPGFIMRHFRRGWRGDTGSSEDGTLDWHWGISEAGEKVIGWAIWNGSSFSSFTMEIAAGVPDQ